MIDIHSHYLPGIDDGSVSADISLEMLRLAVEEGVTDIICTPHYNGRYNPSEKETAEAAETLNALKNAAGLPVNLYLGQEVFFGAKDYDLSGKNFRTLAGSKYFLAEFDTENEVEVYDIVCHSVAAGYIPVIAHAERYSYLNDDYIADLKSAGAVIQVNAGAIAGPEKRFYGKRAKALFKEELVDIVASDCHYRRAYCMKKARKIIARKYGEEAAEKLFYTNAKKIIDGQVG